MISKQNEKLVHLIMNAIEFYFEILILEDLQSPFNLTMVQFVAKSLCTV